MPIPAPFGLTTVSTSLGENLNTGSDTISSAGITNTNQPRIPEFLWYVPATTFGTNLTTEFTTVNSSNLITVSSAGASPRYGFTVPSMSLQYQASTFIYTKASPIVINEDPVQIWYIS
jgi:hypothetical protein